MAESNSDLGKSLSCLKLSFSSCLLAQSESLRSVLGSINLGAFTSYEMNRIELNTVC